MKRWLYASLLAFATSANAYDIKNGHELVQDAECLKCHSTAKLLTYGKATDYPKLEGWVSSCANHFGVDWFPEDIQDVTNYFAKEVYKYPIPE